MKKAEKIELLSANADAKELYYINEEYTRVKYLLKSLSERKGMQGNEVADIIASFRKVRLGSVVNNYIKVQMMMNEHPGARATHYNENMMTTYITEVVSLADRLINTCLSLLSALASTRIAETTRAEVIEKTKKTLSVLADKTEVSHIKYIFVNVMKDIEEYARTNSAEAHKSTEITEMTITSSETEERGQEAQGGTVTMITDEKEEQVELTNEKLYGQDERGDNLALTA